MRINESRPSFEIECLCIFCTFKEEVLKIIKVRHEELLLYVTLSKSCKSNITYITFI